MKINARAVTRRFAASDVARKFTLRFAFVVSYGIALVVLGPPMLAAVNGWVNGAPEDTACTVTVTDWDPNDTTDAVTFSVSTPSDADEVTLPLIDVANTYVKCGNGSTWASYGAPRAN